MSNQTANRKAKLLTVFTLITMGISLASCDKKKPQRDYMPDMYHTTAFKAQSADKHAKDGSSNRTPPEGTIPRDYTPYKFKQNQAELAGRELKNPFKPTKANLLRGQKVYNTYCIVCHGPKGSGNGFVVPPYPRPPSILTDKIRKWTDGRLFHVMTKGQNLMPSYSVQIAAADRWYVAHYVRVLQRANKPTAEDLKELESKKK